MAENIFTAFNYSGQGMTIQRMRLSAVAKNIANANTIKTTDGEPYKREIVRVRGIEKSGFDKELQGQLDLSATNGVHILNSNLGGSTSDEKIIEGEIIKDTSPPRMVYDPAHPDADEKGYVRMPNINVVSEMVEMISAQRSFEANTGVIEAAKNIARDSMDI